MGPMEGYGVVAVYRNNLYSLEVNDHLNIFLPATQRRHRRLHVDQILQQTEENPWGKNIFFILTTNWCLLMFIMC